MSNKTILVVGTYDTKDDELAFMEQCIRNQDGSVCSMDVSVLGEPVNPCDVSKHQVALAADSTIEAAIDTNDENQAMQIMALGASRLAAELHSTGDIDGVIILGGTMGTDLALDVCQALPLGVPKYVVSTVAFSPLIPADRLSPDIQMMLWAGGLYGLNAVCKSCLSQAAGAVLGAVNSVVKPATDKPVVGMTSLGTSCLSYMTTLKPALEERGFEVAIFHATGMGGMAFEKIAQQGGFVCVMDFALSELGNLLVGSVLSAGNDRLKSAGRAGIPQLIAPGCLDLIDFAGWQDIPEQYADRPFHEHNRLVKSSGLNAEERRATAREMATRLQDAKGPVHVFLPTAGIEEWDKPGQPAHDPEALSAFFEECRHVLHAPISVSDIPVHINDQAFSDNVLAVFDGWVEAGIVSTITG